MNKLERYTVQRFWDPFGLPLWEIGQRNPEESDQRIATIMPVGCVTKTPNNASPPDKYYVKGGFPTIYWNAVDDAIEFAILLARQNR